MDQYYILAYIGKVVIFEWWPSWNTWIFVPWHTLSLLIWIILNNWHIALNKWGHNLALGSCIFLEWSWWLIRIGDYLKCTCFFSTKQVIKALILTFGFERWLSIIWKCLLSDSMPRANFTILGKTCSCKRHKTFQLIIEAIMLKDTLIKVITWIESKRRKQNSSADLTDNTSPFLKCLETGQHG